MTHPPALDLPRAEPTPEPRYHPTHEDLAFMRGVIVGIALSLGPWLGIVILLVRRWG